MRSSRSSAAVPLAPPALVERTSLPRILVRQKGLIRSYAYVNGAIYGPKFRYHGADVVPLYYLSFVAMGGHGTTVDSIWSALVDDHPQDVYLETIGTVALAHRHPALASLGYTIHWNTTATEIEGSDHDQHVVIESNMLTMYDPIRGAAPVRRERATGKRRTGRAHKRRVRTTERSTVTKKEVGELEELQNRGKYPAFLLLVPGNERPDRGDGEADEAYAQRCDWHVTRYLANLYFAFLDTRVPLAMAQEWADYLWQRGKDRGENSQLTTWFTRVAEQESLAPPVFAQAWLCRPDIVRLSSDLQQARQEGRISALRPTLELSVPPEPLAMAQ